MLHRRCYLPASLAEFCAVPSTVTVQAETGTQVLTQLASEFPSLQVALGDDARVLPNFLMMFCAQEQVTDLERTLMPDADITILMPHVGG